MTKKLPGIKFYEGNTLIRKSKTISITKDTNWKKSQYESTKTYCEKNLKHEKFEDKTFDKVLKTYKWGNLESKSLMEK